MADKTGIEWTDATWNPITGCSKVSQGCKNCYAERIFQRPYPGRDFTDVRTHPERLEWPIRWRGAKQAKAEGRPSRIFVNSMSDLFHEEVSEEFIRTVFRVMGEAEQHVFQVLTKRPKRMLEIVKAMEDEEDFATLSGRDDEFPFKNVWLGVSVENQETADERIPILLQVPASMRFLSYEPALGPVDLYHCGAIEQWLPKISDAGIQATWQYDPKIDWLIAGGESGPHARPSHPQWFCDVRDQCQAAGVPFFFKQHGEWIGRDIQDVVVKPGSVDPSRCRWVGADGSVRRIEMGYMESGDEFVIHLGKKRAGRLLDGKEWNELPS